MGGIGSIWWVGGGGGGGGVYDTMWVALGYINIVVGGLGSVNISEFSKIGLI